MTKYQFFTNCVNWPASDVHTDGGLIYLIDDAKDITRSTFLKHVDRDQMRALEMDLGYSVSRNGGLTMSRDYHVSYHRSKLHGQTVYLFKHSAIEYVFTSNNN